MKLSFSYVVLRYMHDVFTREFVNVGVVVHCPEKGFLKMKGAERLERAQSLFPGMDRKRLYETLRFMESRFNVLDQHKLRLDAFDAAGLAKIILPTDDSSLQWSAAGGGTTENPVEALEELFKRMVLWHEDKASGYSEVRQGGVVSI